MIQKLEEKVETPLSCWRCGSSNTRKAGYAKGIRCGGHKQRYCKDCKRCYSLPLTGGIPCSRCGSANTKKHGYLRRNNDFSQYHYCNNCKHHFVEGVSYSFSSSKSHHPVPTTYKIYQELIKRSQEKEKIDDWWMNGSELASILSCTTQAVSDNARRLKKAGLVESNTKKGYRINPDSTAFDSSIEFLNKRPLPQKQNDSRQRKKVKPETIPPLIIEMCRKLIKKSKTSSNPNDWWIFSFELAEGFGYTPKWIQEIYNRNKTKTMEYVIQSNTRKGYRLNPVYRNFDANARSSDIAQLLGQPSKRPDDSPLGSN